MEKLVLTGTVCFLRWSYGWVNPWCCSNGISCCSKKVQTKDERD